MDAQPIDGWRQLAMPLSSPMHLLLTARSASGDSLPWPDGTKFTATGGECVYARAFDERVVLFAKASCTESVKLTASIGSTTLNLIQDVTTYAQPTAMQTDALVMPDDIPPPNLPNDYINQSDMGLHVGATGQAYLRVLFDDDPYHPYMSWLTPEELTTISMVGNALTGTSPVALTAAQVGTSDVTATFTLPKPGMPNDPYVLEGTTTVAVLADMPPDGLWIKPDWDWAGSNHLYSTMGEPCNVYHLIARHTSSGSPYYYQEHSWSEATLDWFSTAYATLEPATGEVCPVSPGATLLDVSLGSATKSLTVDTYPEEGQEMVITVQPDPIVITDAMTAGSCTEVHVSAQVGTGPAEDVSANPAVDLSIDGGVDGNGDPLPIPDWLYCGAKTSGDGLECCSYGSYPGSVPPSAQPGVLVVYYAGGNAIVDVTAVD